MIPADLGTELARAIRSLVDTGVWAAAAGQVPVSGTWRPAPGGAPGSYATSLPFELSGLTGESPADIAGRLAELISPVDWVSSAAATGAGYLTITVTAAALARVAVRVAEAGPACLSTDALHGVHRAGRPLPDLAAAPGWGDAWAEQAAALAGRLAAAAGATVPAGADRPPGEGGQTRPSGRSGPGDSGPEQDYVRQADSAEPSPAGPVADAVAYAGANAVRYWLARLALRPSRAPAGGIPVTHDLANPWYAVIFAHADAASVLRWAGDLGAGRSRPDERLAGLLGEPAERELLAQLSWLGERVAGAARREAPAELAWCLEELAAAWVACRESCPALPFGGRAAPRDAAGVSARLWLAAATAEALAAGLQLMEASAPARLAD